MRNRSAHTGGSSIPRHVFRQVFWTSTLTAFTLLGAGFIDSLVISRFLGVDAIAAAGLAYPFYYIAGIVYGCISTGLKSLASRRLSQGDTDGFRRIYGVCMTAAILISFLMTALLLIFVKPVSQLFGARGNSAGLLGITSEYLIGLSVGFPALVINSVMTTALLLQNGSRRIKAANLVCMVLDIVLDLAAVLLDMGIFGIGLASSVSAYAGMLVLCIRSPGSGLIRFRFTRPRLNEIREILHLGSERIFARTINLIRPMVVNPLIISVGGTAAMAVLSVRNSVMSFLAIPGYGISDGVSVTADLSYNIRSRYELAETGKIAHRFSFLYAVPAGLLLCLFSGPVSGFMLPSGTAEEHRLLTFALCMGGIKLFFETLLSARVAYLQAIGSIRDAKILLFVTNFGSVLVCVAVFGYFTGAYGVMAAFTAADLLSCVLVWARYTFFYHGPGGTAENKYLKVADECDVSPGDILELDIRSAADCALTAEQIELFCRGHGDELRHSRRAALCAEEAMTILTRSAQESAGAAPREMPAVKIHMTFSQGKARMHFRLFGGNADVSMLIRRLNDPQAAANDVSESILREFPAEIRVFDAMNVDNLIMIV